MHNVTLFHHFKLFVHWKILNFPPILPISSISRDIDSKEKLLISQHVLARNWPPASSYLSEPAPHRRGFIILLELYFHLTNFGNISRESLSSPSD